ncbi:ABC transporter permease subunit [Lentzea tibetensis]|uniref:ABC transporter permease subunit n=2 Tax=Lentzea tibetensis TaxID=2591470 RepID=A0A563END3_9PSEU|nr:ABC transporter permease subunit [Lentzea tibetensis]
MLVRQLRSELRWMLRRPRTLIGLGGLCLVPIVVGFGVWLATRDEGGGGGAGLEGILRGNGLVLPIFALFLSAGLLLPMVASIWSADGLAGESQHGTLRGLLIAPVSRVRLLVIKFFGLAAMSLFAVTMMAVVGVVSGIAFLGNDGMLTLSGNVLTTGQAVGRIALFVLLITFQMISIGAVGLAISACTEHPLVVQASVMAGFIVFAVLGNLPSLDWLDPFLITTALPGLLDVMRDPMPTEQLWDSTFLAACYLVIGLSLATMRLVTKDS